jgi:peptide/nickel transport system permease protein
MAAYIGKRLFYSLLSYVGLLMLVFVLTRLTGDPAYLYLPVNADQAAREAFSAKYGFNDPIVVQFGRYLLNLLHFDFGTSLSQYRSAMDIALEAFPTTLKLAGIAMAVAVSLAVVLGSLAAYNVGRTLDRVASIVSLAGGSAPDFWVAIIGVLLFSSKLGWLPTSGTGGLEYWILPVAVLALRPFGLLVQVVRGTMIGALSSPYVKTARAKGVGDLSVIFVHALRNSVLPMITVAGDLMVSLVNGAVIVETVFGWPGIGHLMVDAIVGRDFPVVQSTILVTASAVLLINITIDVLYSLLDPRIRHN